MENFQSLNLPESLHHTLKAMGFDTPTPIQAQAIPPALEGRDILGSAQTGTGKTGAFGIPLVVHLHQNPDAMGLILTPTRELAMQVITSLHAMLGKKSRIKTALLIGGESMPKQLRQLAMKPRLIVGTPGRINDHLNRRSLRLNQADFLVLDEMDRMLDMGFGVQLEEIAKYLPEQRQTLMFTATMPKRMERIAAAYLTNPLRVAVGDSHAAAAKVQQEQVHLAATEKFPALVKHLQSLNGSAIVFVKTKIGADKLAGKLQGANISAEPLHGDLKQGKRQQIVRNFRDQRFQVMVATDVAARGLDISHIGHVVNFDLPQSPEDYIHRIGRTGRAGAEGHALSLLTPADRGQWAAIQRMLGGKPDDVPAEGGRRRPSHGKSSQRKPSDGAKKFGRRFDSNDEGSHKPRRTSGQHDAAERRERPARHKADDAAGHEARASEGRIYAPKPFVKRDGKPTGSRDGASRGKRGEESGRSYGKSFSKSNGAESRYGKGDANQADAAGKSDTRIFSAKPAGKSGGAKFGGAKFGGGKPSARPASSRPAARSGARSGA